MQQFGFGAKPVLQVMARLPAPVLKMSNALWAMTSFSSESWFGYLFVVPWLT